MALILGPFATVAHDLDSFGGYTKSLEIALGFAGALIPKRDVVLGGAPLVAVAFDTDRLLGMGQLFAKPLQRRPSVLPEIGGIEIEIDGIAIGIVPGRCLRCDVVIRVVRRNTSR